MDGWWSLLSVFFFAEGKIVKISPETIHVIVLGFSAAVVTDIDIREEFKYRMVLLLLTLEL